MKNEEAIKIPDMAIVFSVYGTLFSKRREK